MKLAAAHALADLVSDDLRDDYIIPSLFDTEVSQCVADAIAARAQPH